jgi:hypothetical protein
MSCLYSPHTGIFLGIVVSPRTKRGSLSSFTGIRSATKSHEVKRIQLRIKTLLIICEKSASKFAAIVSSQDLNAILQYLHTCWDSIQWDGDAAAADVVSLKQNIEFEMGLHFLVKLSEEHTFHSNILQPNLQFLSRALSFIENDDFSSNLSHMFQTFLTNLCQAESGQCELLRAEADLRLLPLISSSMSEGWQDRKQETFWDVLVQLSERRLRDDSSDTSTMFMLEEFRKSRSELALKFNMDECINGFYS